MERYEKVARVHRALAWFYSIFLVLFTLLGLLALYRGNYSSLGGLVFGFIFFGGLFALHYFVARSAWQKKPGARTASRIIGFFMLFGFPIGTIIGIYLLMNAWSPWDTPSDAPTERDLPAPLGS